MAFTKDTTQSLIVRVWIEPREHEYEDMKPEWRGVIENVGNGERIYFNHLDRVRIYLTSFIEAIGGTVDKPPS
jgi:hypothetical protein